MAAPHVDSVKHTHFRNALALTTVGLSALLMGCGIRTLPACGDVGEGIPCWSPIPVPPRLEALRCAETKVDLDFIRAALTRRDEVLNNLYCVDVGAPDDAIFWGRWWAWQRNHGRPKDISYVKLNTSLVHNLLIKFDQYGVVQQHHVVSDKKLLKELAALLHRRTLPSDFSKPIEIPVHHRKWPGARHGRSALATLVLGKDYLQFEESPEPKYLFPSDHNFKIMPTEIRRLHHALNSFAIARQVLDGEARDPRLFFLVMHFSQKTPAGSKITLQLRASDVIPLLKYVIRMSPNVKFK